MAKAARVPRKFRKEIAVLEQGIKIIAGVDEAGRGPLAGPVVAAAVVFPTEWFLAGLPRRLKKINDSKQLTHLQREELFELLVSFPEVCYAWARVEVEMIDQINILQATHRAMNQALAQLNPQPEHVLVDGLPVKSFTLPQTAIVDGDCLSYSIGAASIIAKVSRDRIMDEYHKAFPLYGFGDHKGYSTPEHLAAIRAHGPCAIHRQTFAPFRPQQTELLSMK